MKKLLLAGISLLCSLTVVGQSRIDITHFSLFQQYYNPSLTGNQGSVVKTLYRNQWTGFEDAPQTIFFSGELSPAELRGMNGLGNRRRSNDSGAGNAFGLSVLHDSFGAYAETQLFFSYGSAIRLSETLNLRWGSAISYKSNRIDGSRLSVDKPDPRYQDLLGQNNRKSRVDLNLGIALTTSNYYLGYALQDVAKDGFFRTGDEFLEDTYSRKHVLQAGYRTSLSDNVGVIVNSLVLYDDVQKETIEAQVKGVYRNMLWAGAGYRKDLAFNLTAGVKLNQLQIGYAFEMPAGDAAAVPNNTNEIILSYKLFPAASDSRRGNQIQLW